MNENPELRAEIDAIFDRGIERQNRRREQPDTVQFEDSTGVMRTLTDPEGALFLWDSDRDVAVSENGYEVTALALAVAAKSRKHRWQHLNEAIAEAGPRHRYEDLELAATPFDPNDGDVDGSQLPPPLFDFGQTETSQEGE